MFNILENHYMIDIPTDPELLASMLDANARDWAEVLHFLDTVSRLSDTGLTGGEGAAG